MVIKEPIFNYLYNGITVNRTFSGRKLGCLMKANPASESPIGDESFRRYTRVFQMVSELHKVGYQGLRICPQGTGISQRLHIAPSILLTHHARSNVMVYGTGSNDADALIASYTSSSLDHYFDWEDASGSSARSLANKFIERFPRIAALAFMEDWSYSGWLIRIIGEMENGWLMHPTSEIETRFVLYHDWDLKGFTPFEDDASLTDGYQFMILRPLFVRDAEEVSRLETITYHGQRVRTFPLPPPAMVDNDRLDESIRTILKWNLGDRADRRDGY